MTHMHGIALLFGLWGQDTPSGDPSASEDTRGLQLGVAAGWTPSATPAPPLARAQLRFPVNRDSAMALGLGVDLGTHTETVLPMNDTPLGSQAAWAVRHTELSLRPVVAFQSSPDRSLQGELGVGFVALRTRQSSRSLDSPPPLADKSVVSHTFIAFSTQAALLYSLGPGRIELGASMDLHSDPVGDSTPWATTHLGYRWTL